VLEIDLDLHLQARSRRRTLETNFSGANRMKT